MAKAEVRAALRAARRARSDADRTRAAEAIARHAITVLPRDPGTVTAYLSLPTEPGTAPLIRALRAAGHRVLVPRVEGADLAWLPLEDGTTLRPGPLGIDEPAGEPVAPDLLRTADVMFVPGLAVDAQGRRLGQGGGFYDRVLASVPARSEGGPLLVGVLFDEEVLPEIPYEDHDCRLDAVVTPSGVRDLSG